MSTYRRDRKPDSELVLEFRPAGAMAAQRFHVSDVVTDRAGALLVVTQGAGTQCKAAMPTPHPQSGARK